MVAFCFLQGYKDLPDGVTLFANLPHMHLVGKEILLRHFRDSKELPLIDIDRNYDFNLQDTRLLTKKVQLLPVSCNYTWKFMINELHSLYSKYSYKFKIKDVICLT